MSTAEQMTGGQPDQGPDRRPGRRRAAPVDNGRRRVAVIAGIALLVTLIVVLWLWWAPWSDADPGPVSAVKPAPVKPVSNVATYGAEWTGADGDRYRITVTPAGQTTTAASPGGCVTTASPGQANVRFGVRIDNLGSSKAPVPSVEIGANVGALGQVRQSTMTLARSSRQIELSPRAGDQSCARAAELGPDGRKALAKKGSLTVLGTVGGVDPGDSGTAPGLSLIVRHHQADAASPSGTTAQEFVVPFTLR